MLLTRLGLCLGSRSLSAVIRNWADNLNVRYEVITNLESNSYFNYTITFENGGVNIVNDFPWCVYFNQDQSVKVPGTKRYRSTEFFLIHQIISKVT